MPMDQTDKRLVRGLAYAGCICIAAYFLPWVGYQSERENEEAQRELLREVAREYRTRHAEMPPAALGDPRPSAAEDTSGTPLSELLTAYSEIGAQLTDAIKAKEQASRIAFPEWTEIPRDSVLHPGNYFQDCLQKKKTEIREALRETGVQNEADELGFETYNGVTRIPTNKIEELLRDLFLTQRIIHLCIDAKTREEECQRSHGLRPEAAMHILGLTLEPSTTSGPSHLVKNPEFTKSQTQADPLARKFLVKTLPDFIQEYPIRIVLECDSNTFDRFLYTVRQEQQFLIIRDLEIVSPYVSESNAEPHDAATLLAMKHEPGRVRVSMSLAGMDFYDPKEHPRGLHPGVEIIPPPPPKHVLPTSHPN